MYVDLEKHEVKYIVPIIEARMKVLKNRILKEKKRRLVGL